MPKLKKQPRTPSKFLSNPKNSTRDYSQVLKKSGLKITRPRLAILDVLTTKQGPFTAEEIMRLIDEDEKDGKADLVTIYRCLAKFEGFGLVNICEFGDGITRYELRRHEHHHHIICHRCRRVEQLNACPIEKMKIHLQKTGFRNISHRLEFFGVCETCHEKSA